MQTLLLLFISLICSVAQAENAPSPPPERQTVSIEIENGVELELTARVVAAEKRELHPELCLFEDQLWVGAVSSPPALVMQSAIRMAGIMCVSPAKSACYTGRKAVA